MSLDDAFISLFCKEKSKIKSYEINDDNLNAFDTKINFV